MYLYCYMYICSITRNCNSLRNKIFIYLYIYVFFFFSLFLSMQYLCKNYELCMLNVWINVCSVLFFSSIYLAYNMAVFAFICFYISNKKTFRPNNKTTWNTTGLMLSYTLYFVLYPTSMLNQPYHQSAFNCESKNHIQYYSYVSQ